MRLLIVALFALIGLGQPAKKTAPRPNPVRQESPEHKKIRLQLESNDDESADTLRKDIATLNEVTAKTKEYDSKYCDERLSDDRESVSALRGECLRLKSQISVLEKQSDLYTRLEKQLEELRKTSLRQLEFVDSCVKVYRTTVLSGYGSKDSR